MIDKKDNVYIENGYKDREDYLKCLSEDYNVNIVVVKYLADFYGEEEDFDALINILENFLNV